MPFADIWIPFWIVLFFFYCSFIENLISFYGLIFQNPERAATFGNTDSCMIRKVEEENLNRQRLLPGIFSSRSCIEHRIQHHCLVTSVKYRLSLSF